MDDSKTPLKPAKFCDSIALEEFNQIQSYGGLLVLDHNLHVIQYSENITTLLDITIKQLLTTPILNFLSADDTNENLND